MLYEKKIFIEAKPFALGIRIEHPQDLIDSIQYHLPLQPSLERDGLPPASYNLVDHVDDKAVFSFCMCPGGIIAPAATGSHELVVNGWSPSKRNNPFANSGMVVQVSAEDAVRYFNYHEGKKQERKNENEVSGSRYHISHPLLLMRFQENVERKAYDAGGGRLVAPAQRMVDFYNNKGSLTLPACSYLPGVHSVNLKEVLPDFIYTALRKSFKAFGTRMPARFGRQGYFTNEAILVATESRTSSPVRIPRNEKTLHHPQIKNLYPCGEGAGYAGGIVSAAMDGEKIATAIGSRLGYQVLP